MSLKKQLAIVLVLITPAVALAMTPLYSSGNATPSATANTFGAPFVTKGSKTLPLLDPIGISFFVVGLAAGETLDVRTTAITKYGFQQVDNVVTANGEGELSELELSQLGYQKATIEVDTTVSSSINNSTAVVETVNHFLEY